MTEAAATNPNHAAYRRLADFAFEFDLPVFRQGFYEHVREWRRAMHREFWLVYDADSAFRTYLANETWRRRQSPHVPYRGFYA